MNRRAFLRGGLGVSVLALLNPVKALSAVGLDALKPIIEVGTPLRAYRGVAIANGGDPSLPPTAPLDGSSVTAEQIIRNYLLGLSHWENDFPGIRQSLLNRLMVLEHGLPWERVLRLLYREGGGTACLDEWAHHAWMVSEVGKP